MNENTNYNPYGEGVHSPEQGQSAPAGGAQTPQASSGQSAQQPSQQSYNQTYAYQTGTNAQPASRQTGANAATTQPGAQRSQQQPGAQPSTTQSQSAASSYAPPTGSPVISGRPAMDPREARYDTTGSGATGTIGATSGTTAGETGGVVPPFGFDQPVVNAAHAYPASAETASKGTSGGKTFLIAFAGALVACILAIGACLGFGLIGKGGSNVNLGASGTAAVEASDVDDTLAEAVADKCLPSVVSIDVYGQQQSQGSIYDYLYGLNNNNSGELQQIGLGSGIILSDDGYIITNNHVISSGTQFKVTIEGEKYDAELIGSDPSSDVAVLKVKDGSGFAPITLGDSDDLDIGEWVMSIGSPFGLEQSVATGIVSATSRSQIMDTSDGMSSSGEPTVYPNMIQTDAAINPGNSGGALVDANGELIGVNTLISSYSGNYSGVGFAIPSNYAIKIAQSLISGEEPTHAQLGITMTTVNPSIAERYGFAVDEGAYVSGVASGSAAEKAGLKVGDIITKFDGKDVTSTSDLMLDVRTKNPGDTVTLTINRDGQEQEVQVTLGEAQSTTAPATQQNGGNSGNGYGYGNGGSNGNGGGGIFNF